MPRPAHPWFRSERSEWRVTIRGVDHCLGSHPDGFPAPRKQRKRWNVPQPILDRFHELLVAKPEAPRPPVQPCGLSVADVFDTFLGWCQKHRSLRSYEWYKKHIQAFCDALMARKDLIRPTVFPAAQLRPFHVVEWLDTHDTWGANQRRGAIVAVTRPFNWAAKLGYIDVSPVRGVEKPEAERRDSKLTPDDFVALIAFVKDQSFRDLLTFAYETGSRPQEARQIEARHVRLDQHRIEIPPAETKSKRRWRVIYLSDSVQEIVRRLLPSNPTDRLFVNTDGRPWKVHAVNCRFLRIKRRLGRDVLKRQGFKVNPDEVAAFARTLRRHKTVAGKTVEKTQKELLCEARRKLWDREAGKRGIRFAMYDVRHCFATRKLKEGRDPITVAALLGHKDATMLCKHYEEISRDGGYLREAVNGKRTA